MKYKIVILENRYENHNIEKDILGKTDCSIAEISSYSDSEYIEKECRDADAILVNLYKMDMTFLEKLEKCRVICRYGIGYDNVDAEYAASKGIKLLNVPEYCTEEVTEHILALFFSCIRNVAVKDRLIRKGKWNIKEGVRSGRISGKVFGILGYGKTGQALHRKIAGLGFSRILIYDHKAEKKGDLINTHSTDGTESVFASFDSILSESDFLSLNVPLNEKTKHMIGKESFRKIKQGAVLINASRGGVVDTEALICALEEGVLAGAALDVYENEPLDEGSRLLDFDNVVLTDHAAWFSEDSQADLQRMCARSAVNFLTGSGEYSAVN